MSLTNAQKQASKRYIDKTFDEIKIRVPKGDKQKIKQIAESRGMSVNQFVIRAITNAMNEQTNVK